MSLPTGSVATTGPVVVTSRVTVVCVVTGGSSAQPINASGARVRIQMCVFIIFPFGNNFRFSLDESILFKFDALRCCHADREPWRHDTAGGRNFETGKCRRRRGHAALGNFVEALSNQ